MEFFIKIKLRNSASHSLLLYEYITMHGDQNVKFVFTIQMVLQFPFMAVRLEAG